MNFYARKTRFHDKVSFDLLTVTKVEKPYLLDFQAKPGAILEAVIIYSPCPLKFVRPSFVFDIKQLFIFQECFHKLHQDEND